MQKKNHSSCPYLSQLITFWAEELEKHGASEISSLSGVIFIDGGADRNYGRNWSFWGAVKFNCDLWCAFCWDVNKSKLYSNKSNCVFQKFLKVLTFPSVTTEVSGCEDHLPSIWGLETQTKRSMWVVYNKNSPHRAREVSARLSDLFFLVL